MEITFWGAEAGIYREEKQGKIGKRILLKIPEKQKH